MSEGKEVTLPKIGLTKLGPALDFLGVGRACYKAGVKAGTFPPPCVPSRTPGSPELLDCAKLWAVVLGKDWRQVNSASQQPNGD